MSNGRNIDTLGALKREIKALQANCVNTYNVIENAPQDAPATDPEEVTEKSNSYVKALQIEVHNSNTPISADDNLLTSQFLNELKEKSSQLDELTAYTKGTIQDVDAEINRLKNLMNIANEAQSKPLFKKEMVRPEHLAKAKEKFLMMKEVIHGLIQSMFPECHESMMEVIGELMNAKVAENPDGYIAVTPGNVSIIKMLKDMNLIATNPYNEKQVKFTYFF